MLIIDISKGNKKTYTKKISAGQGERIMTKNRYISDGYSVPERHIRDKKMRRCEKLNVIVSIMLAVIMICCVGLTSECEASDRVCDAESEYFDSFEKKYMYDIRSYLSDKGFINSGITMTSISDDTGRHYSVEIHNDRFGFMDMKDIKTIERNLGRYEFNGDDSHSTDFSYNLY